MTTDKRLYLLPDQAYVSNNPDVVSTVLGSCVSVTFHHPGRGVGAIFHGRLPQAPALAVDNDETMYRFVDSAIGNLLDILDNMGIPRHELKVGVYGGSEGLVHQGPVSPLSVGSRNVATALSVLQQEGLPVHHQDTGGRQGRRLEFTPRTGKTKVRTLNADPPLNP